MSKKKGHRRKRRRKSPPVACPRCHGPGDNSPGALLRALVAILNACTESGMRVRFAYGSALTREGYVVDTGHGRWRAALLTTYGDPLPPDDPDGFADDM